MSVLWCGGEDIDFPNGTVATADTTAGYFRSGFARCGVRPAATNAAPIRSVAFPNGSVTSCWLSARLTPAVVFTAGVYPYFGLEQLGVSGGLYFVFNTNTMAVSIGKGVAGGGANLGLTLLATSSGGVVITSNTISKVDFQVSNYGANGTVNLYINGNLVLSYTGDLTTTGITGFNTVVACGASNGGNGQGYCTISEVIVADESTLGWQGLVTGAPNGNGNTQQWSNPAYTNINPITINDANSSYTDVVGQDQQVSLIPEPSGNYAIKAVRVVARANGPAGSVPTGIKLGFRNPAGTVAVNPAHAITTAFVPYSDIFANDPTTGQPWGDMTGYQLDMRSA